MSWLLRFRFLLAAYVILLLVMFLLPGYSAEGYSILRHTTSQLGAQNTPNAWIMNTVFYLLGAACVLEGWLHLKNYWFHKLFLTIFGLSFIAVAFFQHAPITPGVPFQAWGDEIHSIAATAVGFSFTVLAISAAFISKTKFGRIVAATAGIVAVIFSIMMSTLTDYTGLMQRLMFIVAFAWLTYFLEGFRTPSDGKGRSIIEEQM